ncbi:MAG: hypothetical protein U0360_06555 [Dehalococcoidia bacterium]
MVQTATSSRSLLDRLLRLTWRRVGLVLLAWVLAVILHNVVYGLLYERFAPGWDEPVFFVLAVLVIPAYVVVAAAYTGVTLMRGRFARG